MMEDRSRGCGDGWEFGLRLGIEEKKRQGLLGRYWLDYHYVGNVEGFRYIITVSLKFTTHL